MGVNESKRFNELFPETPENQRVREMSNITGDPRSPCNGIIERTPLRRNIQHDYPIYEEIADPRSPSQFIARTPITQLKDMARDFEQVIKTDEGLTEDNENTRTHTAADENVPHSTPVKSSVFSPPTSPGAALTLQEDKGLLKETIKEPVIRRKKKQSKKKPFKLTEDGQPPRSPLTPRNSEDNSKAMKKITNKMSLNNKNKYKNFNDDLMSPLKVRGSGEIGIGKENSVVGS